MSLFSRFTEHPSAVGETYWQHFRTATRFAAAMIGGGLACLVHALFPFLCVTRGSETISKLHEGMVTNRRRHSEFGSIMRSRPATARDTGSGRSRMRG